MRDSILYSSIRSFFVTIAWLLALAFGLVALVTIVSEAVDTQQKETEIHHAFTPRIQPNEQGIRKELASSSPVILKLSIDGVIGTKFLNRELVEQQLVESREGALKKDRVKGILLYINSPGGTQIDSSSIYHLIQQYKARYHTPVFAYVDGICASGGLYIACAADHVFASPTSIIGSVGVISPTYFNFSKVLNTIGVDNLTFFNGIGKDELNPVRPWKEGEGDNLKEILDGLYEDFISVVAANRPRVDRHKLVDTYGAHIFLAPKAQEIGFIDTVTVSYPEALAALANEAGLEPDEYEVVEMYKETWISDLFNEKNSLLSKGEMQHKLALPEELTPAFNSQFLYLYRP